jgi:hypothetical protein
MKGHLSQCSKLCTEPYSCPGVQPAHAVRRVEVKELIQDSHRAQLRVAGQPTHRTKWTGDVAQAVEHLLCTKPWVPISVPPRKKGRRRGGRSSFCGTYFQVVLLCSLLCSYSPGIRCHTTQVSVWHTDVQRCCHTCLLVLPWVVMEITAWVLSTVVT